MALNHATSEGLLRVSYATHLTLMLALWVWTDDLHGVAGVACSFDWVTKSSGIQSIDDRQRCAFLDGSHHDTRRNI